MCSMGLPSVTSLRTWSPWTSTSIQFPGPPSYNLRCRRISMVLRIDADKTLRLSVAFQFTESPGMGFKSFRWGRKAGKTRFLCLSLALDLSTMQVTVRFCFVNPNFEGENPGIGQDPPPLPETSRENLRLDGYLEYPIPRSHYTFTSIHAFSGIRTHALRHRSQCP
ncbi:hypothetical protein TNCV_208721 [Trichonephila clavipes]|uniref:Uncharacterized protein n=1 Tax=Trichonephila clavipes TaxID=2585209 RepID=A0A8X6VSR4_TRICX|nr:hypothetical protein TNCV_208721 [Trichonephila clavipes]